MNPRAGLKRTHGGYIVPGPRRVMAIDRDRPGKFYVRPAAFPPRIGFFAQAFARLRDARVYAELQAGIEINLAAALPSFLHRGRAA